MSDLKKELLKFKDIVDGMIEQADKDMSNTKDSKEINRLFVLTVESKAGINAIIELAEELEKDND